MLRLAMHAESPQPRHIKRAVEILRGGGLAVYPTDTTYGLGCDLFSQRSINRIYQLRGLDAGHKLSFLCSDLSEVARYAVVEDRMYRILRHHMPGKYTFVLRATREVPKLIKSNSGTVGVRIPDNPVCIALLKELGHPIISTTVSRPKTGDDEPEYLNDADEIAQAFGKSLQVLLDVGVLVGSPSSVVDLTSETPTIIRRGSGDLSWLE